MEIIILFISVRMLELFIGFRPEKAGENLLNVEKYML